MKVVDFLTREAGAGPCRATLAMLGISGVATSLLLALVNLGAERAASRGGIQVEFVLGYLLVLGILFEARRFALTQSALAFEAALRDVRLRLADKLRGREGPAAGEQGGGEAYAPLSESVGALSHAVVFLGPMAESLVILGTIGLYVAWLSPVSFVAVALLYGIAIPIYLVRFTAGRESLRRAAAVDRQALRSLRDLLRRFRAQKLDWRESDAWFDDQRRISADALRLRTAIAERQTNDAIFGSSIFYLALFTVGFVTPALVPVDEATIHQVAAALLFTIAPLAQLVNGAPVLAKAEAAVADLYATEARLTEAAAAPEDRVPPSPRDAFDKIEFAGVMFRLPARDDQPAFAIGPVDVELHRGELVFVIGANGSGKSTLLKGLAGLQSPERGRILLDGDEVETAGRARYSSLFTGVFCESRRLSGLGRASALAATQAMMQEPAVADRTTVFETARPRSPSERVRAALRRSLQSARPICIFDDLTAGQDADFHSHFYDELLPSLARSGRSAIVVSHDERYFDRCDRLLEVSAGAVVERTAAAGGGGAGP
jgi:putative ATP-binding cassette transporter